MQEDYKLQENNIQFVSGNYLLKDEFSSCILKTNKVKKISIMCLEFFHLRLTS